MEIELDSGGVMNSQVDSVGKSGGLMLLWKEEIDITVHSYSLRHIHVTIKEGSGSLPWNITFFYGHPDVSKRKCSWDLLRFLSNTIHNQWLCVGDFNAISNGGEKVGGSDRGGTMMNDFNDALSDSKLVDLGFKGNKYTWSNRRKSPESFIKERLDRSLASLGWLQRWGTYHVEYLTTISSDHSCMYVCWDDRSLRRSALTRRFRYEPNLGAKDACHQLVRQQWVRRIDRGGAQSALSHLQLNLKFFGPKIQKWVVKERQRHAYTEKDLKSKLDSLIAKESHENQEAISAMRHQLQELCELEEKVLLNQSKQHWLKAGDQNTSFFHNSMKRRQNLKGIDKILDEGGCLRTTEPEIAEAFHAYFTSLFSAGSIVENYSFLDSITRLVDADVNEYLCRMVTRDEIWNAVRSISSQKAPGPDGFSAGFYHSHWDTVGDSVVDAVMDFFDTSIMDSEINSTLIALIPKTKEALSVTEYRPISLCNVSYKIISKILSNRLSLILPNIIRGNQSAFIRDRLITDNVIVVYEALHSMSLMAKSRTSYMAIKLDMSKAYDRVEWNFVKEIMSRLGFSDKWQGWIMQCIRSVTYRVLINGATTNLIIPTRGIRQGDSLSPLLFVLCTEGLSSNLKEAHDTNMFCGIPFGRGRLRISHLFFADDSLLFCRVKKEDWMCVYDILTEYGRVSGQMINYSKTSIYFSRYTSSQQKSQMISLIGAVEAKISDHYLGLPAIVGRSRKKAFMFILDRIRKKVMGWSHRNLSQAGKEVFIKSILQAIPTYAMQLFKFPGGLCTEVDQILRKVWWGVNDKNNYMAWLPWAKLCESKKNGGMGFRNTEAFNDALLAKQCWRIIVHPTSLSSRVLKAKYFPSSGFLEVSKKRNASFLWSSFLSARYLLLDGLKWRIGNGRTVKIWGNPWLPKAIFYDEQLVDKGVQKSILVEFLIDWTTGWWDASLIKEIFDVDTARMIMSQPLGSPHVQDSIFWNGTEHGNYTVRSGYFHALDIRRRESACCSEPLANPLDSVWTHIWSLVVPPSTRVFLWRAVHDILPNFSQLHRRQICDSSVCPLCKSAEESVMHSLWECPAAKDVFSMSLKKLQKMDSIFQGSFAQFWIASSAVLSSHEVATLAITMRLIWLRRNKFVHEGTLTHPTQVALQGMNLANDFKSAQVDGVNVQRDSVSSNLQQVWKGPQINLIKANWDAAIQSQNDRTGMGVVFRDASGEVMASSSLLRMTALHPSLAEALAALHAVKLALELGFTELIFEGDAAVVVEAINGSDVHRAIWSPVIMEIKRLLRFLSSWKFVHIRRTANEAAHSMAKHAFLIQGMRVWIEEIKTVLFCPSFYEVDCIPPIWWPECL
ncbi:uncharacterized protein LOC120003559 [Tripterygium wilfordii]|uniref:uncharacterized protein LOC120003559 n=1 Tax=Tripterygium wilfordii TaxID=458696 RepID=UPI0018F80EAB|nr:uncharacterized protein LOC120003559 [Tripterygium wilfordii]